MKRLVTAAGALALLAVIGGVVVSARPNRYGHGDREERLAARQLANPVVVRAGDTVITGGFLFDGVADTVAPNTGIVVRGGIFQSVGTNLNGVDLASATVVRLSNDEYVLPGLFDLHAHYAIDFFGQGRVDEYTVNPVVFLANGATSTFPAGESIRRA